MAGPSRVRANAGTNEAVFDYSDNTFGQTVRTPGPHRADRADQKLTLEIVGGLRRFDVNPNKIAADLITQDAQTQQRLAEMVFALLGHWAEMADITQSTNPLRHVYDTSRKMVNSLFV